MHLFWKFLILHCLLELSVMLLSSVLVLCLSSSVMVSGFLLNIILRDWQKLKLIIQLLIVSLLQSVLVSIVGGNFLLELSFSCWQIMLLWLICKPRVMWVGEMHVGWIFCLSLIFQLNIFVGRTMLLLIVCLAFLDMISWNLLSSVLICVP
jgi:hypothetical protein